jgi:hypothetical protein
MNANSRRLLKRKMEDIMISRKTRLHAAWIAPLALAACLGSAPVLALECPAPQKLSRPGVLKETPTQMAIVGQFLASGESSKTVPLVEADLRARYPGVENAEIVNYIITAYCPVVNGLSGLSDADKQARLSRFVTDLGLMTY